MKQSIHEIAEQLERKRLTTLKLNLSGFVLAAGGWLLNEYLIQSDHFLVWSLLGLGVGLWLVSFIILMSIRTKIRADKALKQLFNDELSALQRLKTWKVAFIALFSILTALFVLSFFVLLDGGMVVELSLFIGISTVLGASIVLEEMLSIAVFQEDFDEEKYTVWNWKHWAFFHWILNPGVAFNELILGQRVPKVLLVENDTDKPLIERNHVPCPHCGTIHDSRVWSQQNKTAFGNWYGMHCTSCGETIPCLQNITSFIILTTTYPLRLPFLAWHKNRWLAKQPSRYENIEITQPEHKKVNWNKVGLGWGAIMFVIMTFVVSSFDFIWGEPEVSYFEKVFEPKLLIINVVIWTLAGLLFGRSMKWMLGPKSPLFKSKKKNVA